MLKVFCDMPDGDFNVEFEGGVPAVASDVLITSKAIYDDLLKQDKKEAKAFIGALGFGFKMLKELIGIEEDGE